MRRDTCPVCEQRAPVTDGVIGHHESEGRSCRGAGRTAAEAPAPQGDAPRPAEENRTKAAAPVFAALGLVGLVVLVLGAVLGSVPILTGGAVLLVAAGAGVLLNRRSPAAGERTAAHSAAGETAGETAEEREKTEEAAAAVRAEPEPLTEPRQEAERREEEKESVSGSVLVETVSVEETAPERLSVGGLFFSDPADSAPRPERSDLDESREESRDSASPTPEPEHSTRGPEVRDDASPEPETGASEAPEPRADEPEPRADEPASPTAEAVRAEAPAPE
ncbi:hypothetical protein L7D48_22040, partial [Streptomyces sp. S1A]|nr:hypothetical protein [Streptomyces sp. ICN903]